MIKKKFIIVIEETVAGEYEITAENKERARELAIEKYNACEIVLEPGELISKRILVCDEDNASEGWVEF